jgi:cytochrome c oxidase subunit 2
VLHSFFLPNFRIKQDVVPGMRQAVWFQAEEEGEFDIVCAELCGWGHYKMKGRITIESREEYEAWLAEQSRRQNATRVQDAGQSQETKQGEE